MTAAERAADLLTSLLSGGAPGSGRLIATHTHRQDVEDALGDTGPAPDGVGRFGQRPATFREYPESPLAPFGVLAWFDGDHLLGLEIPVPALPPAWDATLGQPDRTGASPLGRGIERAGWDGAGVVLHRHRATGEVERLDVLAAASVEWLDDERPIRRERR